jgi:hypothetical protein
MTFMTGSRTTWSFAGRRPRDMGIGFELPLVVANVPKTASKGMAAKGA